MSLYEHIFIARQDISEQQVEKLADDFSNVIAENGGHITKKEFWGLRTLAYRVKKNRKGHYVLLNIDGSHETISELERQLSLHEDVIRYMTLRVDEHDAEPSAPLQAKMRDERRAERRSAIPETSDMEIGE